MCLLNKKYSKYLNETEQKRLLKLEKYYFNLNCIFWGSSAFMIISKPFQKFKFINFYLAFVLLMSSRYNSMFLIKEDIIEFREKLNNEVEFKKRYYDLFDDTLIPDWRCYMYYYKMI